MDVIGRGRICDGGEQRESWVFIVGPERTESLSADTKPVSVIKLAQLLSNVTNIITHFMTPLQ